MPKIDDNIVFRRGELLDSLREVIVNHTKGSVPVGIQLDLADIVKKVIK